MSYTNFDRIDRYLSHEMDGEELSRFEQEIQANYTLAAEVRFHMYVNDSIAKNLYPSQPSLHETGLVYLTEEEARNCKGGVMLQEKWRAHESPLSSEMQYTVQTSLHNKLIMLSLALLVILAIFFYLFFHPESVIGLQTNPTLAPIQKMTP